MLDLTKPILLHNNEPAQYNRQYKMVFEGETPETVDISYKAYEAFNFKLDLRLRYIENPYFEPHYLFTTITPEHDVIRYFFVEFSESQYTYRSYYIVQDCVNASGNSGAIIYDRNTPETSNTPLHEVIFNLVFCPSSETSYTPLHDLFLVDLNVSIHSCLSMFLDEASKNYPDFKSVFQDPLFEDKITQFVLLGY